MPNARKPTALKVLEGTDRKDRMNPAEPKFELAKDSDPPDWLDGPEAQNEWVRLYGVLSEQRVLTEADRTMLAHLCNFHGKLVRTWRVGEKPTAAEMTQLRMMYREFGLTPASRAGVSAGESKDKNDFAELAG